MQKETIQETGTKQKKNSLSSTEMKANEPSTHANRIKFGPSRTTGSNLIHIAQLQHVLHPEHKQGMPGTTVCP